ncbi:MAG TPA: helix-hairpin-helix domain-containing protein [Candidatus Acidoferrales bacterium]|nr:helix-hairpin-helix domain-containing protein [Candidatus Acidoferrales bacterium]
MEKKSSSPELPAEGRSQERAAAGSAAPARRGSSTRLIAILGTLAAYLFLAIWLRPEMAGPLSGPLTDLHDSVSDRLRKHPDHPIDLNTATPAELQELPGVGPATAAQIIHFREQSGPIRRPEDLLALPRFTRKTLERIRPYVVVGSPQ